MTRIEQLRRQLGSLNRRHAFNERGAATFKILAAFVVVGLSLFLVDWLFDLPVAQRVVAMAAALAAAIQIIRRWGLGGAHRGGTPTQTALQLPERRSDDLVAALQFAGPNDTSSGSSQLKHAVVAQVEESPIDVFQGFTWTQLQNAFFSFAIVTGVVTLLTFAFPLYAEVFFDRMALGQKIYPRSTEIVSIAVNHANVLTRRVGDPAAPADARCPQGKPLVVQVRTAGAWPDSGALQLSSQRNASDRVVEFERMTKAERIAELRSLLTTVENAKTGNAENVEKARQALAAAMIDLPAHRVENETNWDTLKSSIRERVKHLGNGPTDAIWRCELPRLVEPATYRVAIGDSRTAPGRLDVAEIPIVELNTRVESPKYAGGAVPTPAPSARQFTVLEGSNVTMTVRSLTEKPLGKVELNFWQDEDEPKLIRLQPADEQRLTWKTASADLQRLQTDLRYEITAEDEHGFSIENPIRGVIRIRQDRAPTARINSVHRVVLPNAAPVISVLANDDFGVAKVVLHAQVERQSDEVEPLAPGVSGSETLSAAEEQQAEARRFTVLDRLSLSSQLPVKGEYTLQLGPLKIAKGDRLKLTAEVLDGRGDLEGEWANSESIYLEISDESGVLNAISEPDERSEQRLDDLIRRQLGIGDEP